MNIYPENFETKINFETIREYLKEYCLSPMGIEKVDAMHFSIDFNTINSWLTETEEFTTILKQKEKFPTEHYIDLRDVLKQIETDALIWMSEKEISLFLHSLQTILDIVQFFNSENFSIIENNKYPILKNRANQIKISPSILDKANAILDKSGHIKDQASKLLSNIRKNIIEAEKDISKSMTAALRSAQSQGIIGKDVKADMRGDHFLIPVTASNKRKIKGIVRDSSGSGKTFFIEPKAVVAASNRLRELQNEERKEIIRILNEFTNYIRPQIKEILEAYDFLGMIDFIQAKASFAIRINAVKPKLQNSQIVEWHHAIHPLLDLSLRKEHKKAYPLDILLNSKQRILIVSGVNAGGKTLCLKTVALLQYMLQCGLLIPVDTYSKAGVFNKIFMDIGDGQSMENSLSTYTSHLTHMKFFVEHNDDKTLLMIDEFGGGTEPQIGGAIAEALLQRFNDKKSFGLITTHFQNLKHFAYMNEGVVNGAMLFDAVNNRPLYKLSIGNPGSSFAIEVARRIGLHESIITDASNKIGKDYFNMDYLLQTLSEEYQIVGVEPTKVEETLEEIEEIIKSQPIKPLEIPLESKVNIQVGDKVRLIGQYNLGTVIELKNKDAVVAFGMIKTKVNLSKLEIVN